MLKSLQVLFEKVDFAHDDHSVPSEATARVKEAIQEHISAVNAENVNHAISTATEMSNKEIARLEGALKAIDDLIVAADDEGDYVDEDAIRKIVADNLPKSQESLADNTKTGDLAA